MVVQITWNSVRTICILKHQKIDSSRKSTQVQFRVSRSNPHALNKANSVLRTCSIEKLKNRSNKNYKNRCSYAEFRRLGWDIMLYRGIGYFGIKYIRFIKRLLIVTRQSPLHYYHEQVTYTAHIIYMHLGSYNYIIHTTHIFMVYNATRIL